MKKTLILAAAVVFAAACTKSSVTYDDATEIGLTPVNYTVSKAPVYGPVEDANYPSAEEMGVFAQYTADAAGTQWSSISDATGQVYLNNVTFKTKDNTVWQGKNTSYYWPRTGSLFFAGYSPAAISGTASCAFAQTDGSTITITDFTQGDYRYTDGKSANNSQPADYTMVDLMYFDVTSSSTSASSKTNLTGNNAYAVVFNHALSWLTFEVTAASTSLDNLFHIHKMTVKGLGKTATFTSGTTPAWGTPSASSDLVIFDDENGTMHGGTFQLTNASPIIIDDVLVIPQEIPGYSGDATLEIVFSQRAAASDEYPFIKQTKSVKLSGGDGNEVSTLGSWYINKHYLYKISFTLDEILLEPSVNTWAPTITDNIEIGNN